MSDLDSFTKPGIPMEELRDRMIKLQRDIELLRARRGDGKHRSTDESHKCIGASGFGGTDGRRWATSGFRCPRRAKRHSFHTPVAVG